MGIDAHESFVLELLEGRVYRAGARLPDTSAPLGDLLDDLVSVHGTVGENGQDRHPHVAAASLRAAEGPPRATEGGTPAVAAEGRGRPRSPVVVSTTATVPAAHLRDPLPFHDPFSTARDIQTIYREQLVYHVRPVRWPARGWRTGGERRSPAGRGSAPVGSSRHPPRPWSYSSEQADVVAQVEQPLEQSRARAWRPVRARASASQKLQARKAPSEPGSPSTVPCCEVGSASGRYRRTNPSSHSSRCTASTVPSTRGSSGGRKPDAG